MGVNAMDGLVAAMIRYLQSAGISPSELAQKDELTPRQLAALDSDLSPSQLRQLWQLARARILPSLTFSLEVRTLIAGQLDRGRVRVAAIAKQLNMSRQTLHRKLKAENLTYASLLDEVRCERALAYLQEGTRPLSEVAELLGFSELSAFSRAFKRWMGQSPARFRASSVKTI